MITEWKIAWGRLSGHLHIWPAPQPNVQRLMTRGEHKKKKCKSNLCIVEMAGWEFLSSQDVSTENRYSQKRCGGLGRAGQATKLNTSQKEWKDLRNATRHLQRVLTSGAGRSCQQIQLIIRTRWNMKLIPDLKIEKKVLLMSYPFVFKLGHKIWKAIKSKS